MTNSLEGKSWLTPFEEKKLFKPMVSQMITIGMQTDLPEMMEKVNEYIKMAIEKNIPNIIAHPDLYMLSRNNFGEAEEQVARIICSRAEKYGIPVEINLSDPVMYIRKQKEKVEYPCKEFWKIASEYKNLKVLYGIDAHWREQIELYEKAVELANEIIGKDIISKLHFCDENLEI